MKAPKKKTSRTLRAMQYAALLAGLYVLLLFVLPANTATMHEYDLSSFEYRIIAFAVALPSLVSWFAGFIGYAKLREYAMAIRKTPEGIWYDRLAEGCTWLAWSLPVATIIPFLLNAVADDHAGFHATSIIISNYIALLLPLFGFSIIATASQNLLSNIRVKLSLYSARLIIAGFLMIGVLYCYLVFKHLNLGSLSTSDNPYFLPAWLLVTTIIMPYLYAWFMGLLGAYELTLYRKHVHGVLYKQALGLVVGGLIAVILSFVALQYVGSIEPRIGHLMFNNKLLFISIFRIVGGTGFVLIAIGATRLKKIEEV